METLTIGQVAKRSGVKIETIRFYEREALIAPPARSDSGYRKYPLETVRRIRFIRRAKELGFTLKEIAELLALKADPKSSCGDVKLRVADKIDDLDQRLRSLQNMKSVLTQLMLTCGGRGSTNECPILDALDDEQQP